jgi:hypothetical protein
MFVLFAFIAISFCGLPASIGRLSDLLSKVRLYGVAKRMYSFLAAPG